jgi:mRNA-degrading endonuclease toxin of MazEF toxin-antitoxin module
VNVGDVYWVEFPAGAGRAQAGRRPAIIAQGERASSRLPTVLLIPLTTQLDALRFPGTVLIETDAENGLRRASVALVFQLTVLDRRLMGERLGQISNDVLQNIWSALDEITERALPFVSEPQAE